MWVFGSSGACNMERDDVSEVECKWDLIFLAKLEQSDHYVQINICTVF